VIVYTAHHSAEIPFHAPKLIFAERAFAALADQIVAPSRQVAQLLTDVVHVPTDKLVVIPHGVDTARWRMNVAGRARVRDELGCPDAVLLGSVGRLYRLKNFAALIRALAPAVALEPRLHLIIVGDGDPRELLGLIDRCGMGAHVTLTGHRSDIVDVVSAIDLYVHPSLAEGFGMSIVEAMALGKPTITTPVGIAPELIQHGHSGFLFAGTTTEALSAGLLLALSEQAIWGQLAARGQSRARTLTAAAMAKAYAAHYATWIDTAAHNRDLLRYAAEAAAERPAG